MLRLSDDSRAMAEAVRDVLADSLPLTDVRRRYGEPIGRDDPAWRNLVDVGVVSALVPEDQGGLGLSLNDIGGVLVELGRGAYPGPFISTAITAATLLSDPELVGDLVAGAPFAVAFDTSHVADAVGAERLLLVEGTQVFLAESFDVEPIEQVDGTRAFASVTVHQRRELATADVSLARQRTIAARCADGLGVAQALFEIATDYAKTRQQFDKPIGSFQAVQHLLVDAFATLTASSVGVQEALIDPSHASLAKAFVSDGLVGVATNALQVLGGIGFTWEHDAQLYYKRLLTLQTEFGATGEHLDALAGTLL